MKPTVLKILGIIIVSTALMMLSSCKSDQQKGANSKGGTINIRLDKDPEKLNPVFYPTTRAREVYQYIFVQLADYDPSTMELIPILIEDIPKGIESENGITFRMKIRKDAKWSDDTPVTADDLAFTLKSIMHPQSNAIAYRQIVSKIQDIKVDPNNPQNFEITVDKDYMLAKELAVSMSPLPKHIYDPNGLLDNVDFKSLNSPEAKSMIAKDTSLVAFATDFNNPKNYTDNLVGCGPYRFESRSADQFIKLKKVDNYWGSKYPKISYLQGMADELIFKVISDENTAITALKDGQLDLLKLRSSGNFDNLKKDKKMNSEYHFFSPSLDSYTYILLNNENPILNDIKVRNALARVVDVEELINGLDYGYGAQSIGPIHLSKPYFNDKISPIKYDKEKSMSLLTEAGWTDSDSDGDLDKVINGTSTDLELDLLISGATSGKNAALKIQDAAKRIGIRINIIEKNMKLMRKENLYSGNYDMALLLTTNDNDPLDPYLKWHSESTDQGEQNLAKYRSDEADKLIMQIRSTRDEAKRNKLYFQFQEIIHRDQPVIFLYCPAQKIIVSKRLDAVESTLRPGYFANTFSLN